MLRLFVLAAAHILEGESSEQCHAGVLEVLERGIRRLQRWREVHERDFPNDKHDIPDPDGINTVLESSTTAR